MFQVNSHLSVNSCLIYMISIYGSYFKVHPLRFWYRAALLLGNGRGKKDQETKTRVYSCRATTLCSLMDVRSWIYKTKAVSALPTCSNSLLTDGWEINGNNSKESALPVSWSKMFGKMFTISKWQSGVCHFILSVESISHVFIVALVSVLLYTFFYSIYAALVWASVCFTL